MSVTSPTSDATSFFGRTAMTRVSRATVMKVAITPGGEIRRTDVDRLSCDTKRYRTSWHAGLEIGGDLTIVGGGGNDMIGLNQVNVQGRTSLRSGGGDDVVVVNRSFFGGRTTVAAGGGEDMICVAVGSGDGARGFTGGGGDNVTFNDVLRVRMAGGDDRLNVGFVGPQPAADSGFGNVNLGDSTVLVGGGGTDFLSVAGTVVDPSQVDIEGLTIRSFEVPVQIVP